MLAAGGAIGRCYNPDKHRPLTKIGAEGPEREPTVMINVSERAAAEMQKVISEQDTKDAAIRVFVSGACGCGSAHYGMGVEDEIAPEESIIEMYGIKLVVDAESAPYLEGAEIDYQDGLMGHGFTIKSPSAGGGGGCGCGSC
ncbi:MAG: iron-sulfur cluster assembly protein [Chloroflexota bacterium]|jgi:iron-sulfur cluster insertion protein|nr:iron-sulfur cluster assembly protein [Chloroflexota bacterium]